MPRTWISHHEPQELKKKIHDSSVNAGVGLKACRDNEVENDKTKRVWYGRLARHDKLSQDVWRQKSFAISQSSSDMHQTRCLCSTALTKDRPNYPFLSIFKFTKTPPQIWLTCFHAKLPRQRPPMFMDGWYNVSQMFIFNKWGNLKVCDIGPRKLSNGRAIPAATASPLGNLIIFLSLCAVRNPAGTSFQLTKTASAWNAMPAFHR